MLFWLTLALQSLYPTGNIPRHTAAKNCTSRSLPSDTPGDLIHRQTRSNKVFSPWTLCHIDTSNPQFDLEHLLKKKIQEENRDPDGVPDDAGELDEEEEARYELPESLPSECSEGSSESDGDDFETTDAFGTPSSSTPSSSTAPQPCKPNPNPVQSAATDVPASRHKRKRNAASHAARARKRARPDFETLKPRKSVVDRQQKGTPSIQCTRALDNKGITQTGFVGKRDLDAESTVHPLEYFVGEGSKGFTLHAWDGKYVAYSSILYKKLTVRLGHRPFCSTRTIASLEFWLATPTLPSGLKSIVKPRRRWSHVGSVTRKATQSQVAEATSAPFDAAFPMEVDRLPPETCTTTLRLPNCLRSSTPCRASRE